MLERVNVDRCDYWHPASGVDCTTQRTTGAVDKTRQELLVCQYAEVYVPKIAEEAGSGASRAHRASNVAF